MRYSHIASLVFGRPWMILPETLDTIVELLAFRMDGGHLTAEEIDTRLAAAGSPRQRQAAAAGPGVAVLQLYGVIAPKAALLEDTSSGGTGLDTFMRAFRTAMADPEVGSIVLDVDSPGGQVGGIPEAAAEIRAARDTKPITTVVNNGIAGSAAYYLGSQAGEIVASPSSEVGSIGVRMAHEDRSGFYEQKGVRTTLISAGKYKDEGNPYGPLSEEGLAYAQAQVDTIYEGFLADVAKGRHVPVGTVREDFGQGRMLLARDALKAGMIDRIDTLDGVLRRELGRPRKAQQAMALGPALEFDAADLADGFTAASAALVAGPVAPHKTETSDKPWDGPANEARLPSPMPVATARAGYAWMDAAEVQDGQVRKEHLAFIHHEVDANGNPGPANLSACSNGIGVCNGGRGSGPGTRWWGDRAGIHAHMAGHMRDAGREPAPLRSEGEALAFELELHRHRG